MFARRFRIAALAIALCGIASFLHGPANIPGQEDTPTAKPLREKEGVRIAGSPSCSAASCHGAVEPRESPTCNHNEFTLWSRHDPHRNAFDALRGDLGQRMGKLLGITPHEDPSCLACHSNPYTTRLPDEPKARSIFLEERRWGIGCESCHGAAQDWLAPHTKPDWIERTSKEKARLGMTPLDDLALVFRNCAGCHVGAPAGDGIPVRDVTHDMIAAGHPRLLFEPSTFLENLPPHWGANRGKRWNGDRPSSKDEIKGRTWAIGQIVAAECSLALLLDRVERTPSTWPELAEFSCYACHHDLQSNSWRQEQKLTRRPGTAPWSEWYWTGPRILAPTLLETIEPDTSDWRRSFDALYDVMQIPSKSPRAEVKFRITQMQKNLESMLVKARSWEPKQSRATIVQIGKSDLHKIGDWDAAEQIYLGLLALNADARLPGLNELLHDEKFVNVRAFPQGWGSPQAYHPAEFYPRLKAALLKVEK